jgi:hypothetical protein
MRAVAVVTTLAVGFPSVLCVRPLHAAQPSADAPDRVMRKYIEQIDVGSRVTVTLNTGDRLRGVLMLVEDDVLVLRERKRRPEPPIRVALDQVADVEVERKGGGIGRAIAIGAAVGAGAALGVIAFLAAMISD